MEANQRLEGNGLEALREAARRRKLRQSLPSAASRRRIRERSGVSQGEMAQALGVTVAAISRWEAGTRTPRDPAICELYARALKVLEQEVGM